MLLAIKLEKLLKDMDIIVPQWNITLKSGELEQEETLIMMSAEKCFNELVGKRVSKQKRISKKITIKGKYLGDQPTKKQANFGE